jgi:hypothetical protein
MKSTQIARNALRSCGASMLFTNLRADGRTVKCYVRELHNVEAARGKVLRELRKAGFSGCSVDLTAGAVYPHSFGGGFIVRLPMDF